MSENVIGRGMVGMCVCMCGYIYLQKKGVKKTQIWGRWGWKKT